jgi:transcriptional regulator with XRE-family HTH domain
MTTTATRPWTTLKRALELDGHWTHERLADATGYSKAYITQLLTGHRPPTRTVIEKFADLLSVPKSMIEAPQPERRISWRIDEVAAMTGLDEPSVLQLVQAGELTAKAANGTLLVTDAALTQFFSDHAADDDTAAAAVPEQRGEVA